MVRSKVKKYIEKIETAIKDYFKEKNIEEPDLIIDASGISDNIHVIIVSDSFTGKEQIERDNEIYKYFDEKLSPEIIVKISMLLTLTEEEYSKYQPELSNVSGVFEKHPY